MEIVRDIIDVQRDILGLVGENSKPLVYELLREYRILLRESIIEEVEKHIDTFKTFTRMRN